MDSCIFAGSSNISDKRAVVSRQFCGPLGNTFPRWSRAGGTACRQRFALNILLACSHHPPNLSGVAGGMLCPFRDLLIRPLQPGMHSTCTSTSASSVILLYSFSGNQYLDIFLNTCIICIHWTKRSSGIFNNANTRVFFPDIFFWHKSILVGVVELLIYFSTGKLINHIHWLIH